MRKYDAIVAHHEDDGGGLTKKRGLLQRGDLEWNFDPPAELRAYREILVNLAGPYAHRRCAPRSDWRQTRHHHHFGGTTDFSHVSDFVNRLYGDDPKVIRPYLRFVEARAEQLVEQHWPEIEHVAARLLERRKITGQELKEAMHDALMARAKRARAAAVALI